MSAPVPTNVLVVDDLQENLLTYRTILEDSELNLVLVSSGEEALRAVLSHDFAVILLDVNMPGMNGLEAAGLIRKRRRSAHTPIIFVTAFADELRTAEGYAQGAVDFITTPIVPTILKAKVRVFADLYRMTQQVKRQAEERIALAEERNRREAAEQANRRLTFLAQAGAVLIQSLEPEITARNAVQLPIPELADVSVLSFLQSDGQPGRCLRGAMGPAGPTVEGLPSLGDCPDDEVRIAIERTLAGESQQSNLGVILLPLRVKGKLFGMLALSRVGSGRVFADADHTVANAFGSRAAIALENSRLYHEVQLADRQKNEFLSMLAHELRNPLAPIRNANDILHQKSSDQTRVQWAHGVIDRQLTHMVRLVDDLLDVSRLTLGKIRLTIEPVDIRAVVTQAVEAVSPLVDQFGHRLDVSWPSRPLIVQGDAARLTQVFTNLLNNAIKYTDPGGRITLIAEEGGSEKTGSSASQATTPSPLSVVIRVRDSGIGISPELLPTVFDLFTQANRSLDRSQGGLGVGLTLVRRLVEMHGGSVTARSEGPGKGSEFVVQLPVTVDTAARTLAKPVSQTEAPAVSAPLRVVVVDDHVDGAESLADLLRLLGHQVRVANDGVSGIVAVREFDPDLVLLDIGLPGTDGYEVARQLRREPGARAVLVALSGYGRDEDRRQSRASGFAQHFVKPIEFGTLRSLLDSIRLSLNGATPSSNSA